LSPALPSGSKGPRTVGIGPIKGFRELAQVSDADRYRRLGRRLACQNRMFEVFFDAIETPGGEVIDNFLIVRPRNAAPGGIVGVCVLPEFEGRIGLMRGWRHQLDEEIWQAPAGFVDAGETAAETALRELAEETLLRCPPERIEPLGVYLPDAGLVEGRVGLFVARGCVPAAGDAARHREVGTSALQYFDRAALSRLIRTTPSVGGSTLVACFRYLAATGDAA
jgi:8-oxo-dGTP pyrophosphatase MutT (NUDIX family)